MERGAFKGRIGRTWVDSEPYWPPPPAPPEGAPNVLLVVLDDVGFAQLGCFGSDIDTPVIDSLASAGLRYTNFHTTSLCSPTRACLLSGRNHHVCGMGRVIELATGFPGYDARLPRSCGLVSEVLVERGWATFAVGKWHLAPEEEVHMAATRVRWPLQRGFERFYGFMGGETHQFAPALVEDNHFVDPPLSIEEGYHLTEDLVDHAISFLADLRATDPDKPFFMYFCPGACHAPHQVPPAWIDRYRGAFDGGWDAWRDATFARQRRMGLLPPTTELSPRPPWVPAWDELSPQEQRLAARYMEAFAGFLSHTDHHLGRLLRFLERTGDLERTLVIVLSDNGASSEGGPQGSLNDGRSWNLVGSTLDEALARIDEIGGPWCHNNYPWGWTVAGNTPFRRWKREVHEGGVADPLVVHWPRGIRARGECRRQYVHAIDVAATVLDVAGVEPPAVLAGVAQEPIEGVSFAHTFDDPTAPSRRRTQYYEMFGCRAIYHDGYKAVTYHPIQDATRSFDDDQWELYDVELDPSECHDLAAERPELLRALVDLWWAEAGRHQVLPLDNRPISELVLHRPKGVAPRARYVVWPEASMLPEHVGPNVHNRTHRVRARIELPSEGVADGVVVSQGSGLGGWLLYFDAGRLVYVHNLLALEEHRVEAAHPLDQAALAPEARSAAPARPLAHDARSPEDPAGSAEGGRDRAHDASDQAYDASSRAHDASSAGDGKGGVSHDARGLPRDARSEVHDDPSKTDDARGMAQDGRGTEQDGRGMASDPDGSADASPALLEVGFDFERTGEHRGTVRLFVGGQVVGEGEVSRFTPVQFSGTGMGLTVGRGNGLPVTRRLTGRSPFNGRVDEVVIEVEGDPWFDPAAEAQLAIFRQ
jgi:arylsulfatase A-like enzyme